MCPCAHAIGAAWTFHGATAATAGAAVAAALDVAAEAAWNEPKPSSPTTAANAAARYVRGEVLRRRGRSIMLMGIGRAARHLNHSNEQQPLARRHPGKRE